MIVMCVSHLHAYISKWKVPTRPAKIRFCRFYAGFSSVQHDSRSMNLMNDKKGKAKCLA